jgi:hypothetical protein
VPPQRCLDELLGHPVRQFSGAPGSAHGFHRFDRLSRGGQADPRQLVPAEAREIDDVGGMVRRQPERPDLVGESQPAKVLHGARLRRIRLRIEGRSELLVHQQASDATPPELVGEHEPAWTAAGDQNLGFQAGPIGAWHSLQTRLDPPRWQPGSRTPVSWAAPPMQDASNLCHSAFVNLMKTTPATTFSLALALLFGASSVGAQDKPVELKFAHWLPAAHSLAKNGFEPWAKSVEAASKGSIKVATFPAQQLGKAADHYDMARDGIADMTWVNPGYQAGRFPIFAAGELPFLIGKPGPARRRWISGTGSTRARR